MSNKVKRFRDKSLNIRLTNEEVLRLKLKAEVQGTTVSKLIREAINSFEYRIKESI